MKVPDHAQPFHAGRARIAVLFLHDFNSSPHSLREWAKLTADAGYRVALPRLPGHGTNWRELNATRWRDWYSWAERELLTLAAESDQVFVAGEGMGGSLALRLAERHPDSVSGLAILDPALASRAPRLGPLASRLRARLPSPLAGALEPGTPHRHNDHSALRAAVSLRRLFTDIRAGLDLVECPILVFRSGDRDVSATASTDYLRTHVSSEEITVRRLSGSGKGWALSRDGERVYSETLRFIAAHSH